ncbi:hypothetical protein GS421_16035 [Rhodococcus hoagii]|nr:hypothetical protein [Prescottella equi]
MTSVRLSSDVSVGWVVVCEPRVPANRYWMSSVTWCWPRKTTTLFAARA